MADGQGTASGDCPFKIEDISFRDRATQNCPYPAYKRLRDEAPVWKDGDGQYHVTRYDLLQQVLRDDDNFSGEGSTTAAQLDRDRQARIQAIFKEKGWVPTPPVARLPEPDHTYMRRLFGDVFLGGKLRDMDVLIEKIASDLIDGLIDRGECDWVREFAAPLPLTFILRQSGIPVEDMWRIKSWVDAWVEQHLSFMQDEEAALASVDLEIERQHYFEPIFQRLRANPDGSVISDLVNAVVPEWGHGLSDEQVHTLIGNDLLVGGIETTANALASGMKLLIDNPDVWALLKEDPDTHLRKFVDEVVRLESPAQALYRVAARDIELAGVLIPKGATIALRFGAANRDERQFPDPDKLDIARPNGGSHLAFGQGTHACLGQPLARRELFWAFRNVVTRFASVRYAPGKNDFAYEPSKSLRGLQKLHIEFEAA